MPPPPEKQFIPLKAKAAVASPATSKGEAELALARGLLHDDDTPEEIARGIQQLWVAVEKGNIEAEVELADRFVQGQGVPRNCDQARVLLTAASNANNAAAIDKLKNLDESCQ